MKGQENAQRGPGWAAFPHRRSYSRGIGIAWHPSRTLKPDQTPMWPGHQFSINHWQKTILHQFMNLLYVLELMSDLIWSLRENMFDTSGRKTIASVPGSHPEKNLTCCRKPCSTSGFVRRQLFRRYYSDSSWSYLVMFKFAPQVPRRETFFDLFRPFADSCLRCLAFGWNKTIPVSFEFKIIPKI